MVRYLVKDYYNKHRSFKGIEKNDFVLQSADAPDFLQWCYECLGISSEKLKKDVEKQRSAAAIQKYNSLDLSQKEVVMLLIKSCIASDFCRSKNDVLVSALFNRNTTVEGSTQKMFKEAIDGLTVKAHDCNFMRANVLYTKHVNDFKSLSTIAAKILNLMQKVILDCCNTPFELLGVMAIDKKYNKLLVLAESLDLSFEQLLDLFNLSLPDQQQAIKSLGTIAYIIAPNVYMVYNYDGAHLVTEENFHSIVMQMNRPFRVEAF